MPTARRLGPPSRCASVLLLSDPMEDQLLHLQLGSHPAVPPPPPPPPAMLPPTASPPPTAPPPTSPQQLRPPPLGPPLADAAVPPPPPGIVPPATPPPTTVPSPGVPPPTAPPPTSPPPLRPPPPLSPVTNAAVPPPPTAPPPLESPQAASAVEASAQVVEEDNPEVPIPSASNASGYLGVYKGRNGRWRAETYGVSVAGITYSADGKQRTTPHAPTRRMAMPCLSPCDHPYLLILPPGHLPRVHRLQHRVRGGGGGGARTP